MQPISIHMVHLDGKPAVQFGRLEKARRLPAGLGHAGNEAVGGHLAESDPGHLEATHEGATATGDAATIDQASGARITGKQ